MSGTECPPQPANSRRLTNTGAATRIGQSLAHSNSSMPHLLAMDVRCLLRIQLFTRVDSRLGWPHSITKSARLSSVGGTVRPIDFAVFWLITSSNVVGCSIGIALGLPPATIFWT
jgi:hypothetical protein